MDLHNNRREHNELRGEHYPTNRRVYRSEFPRVVTCRGRDYLFPFVYGVGPYLSPGKYPFEIKLW
jgi:hypothetical protein